MDLFNNDFGINLTKANPGLSELELAELLCNYLNSGDLKILADPNLSTERVISSSGCQCN
ncbi:MAG: hypothetical protein HOP11_06575 [Saprospiraceae bacterium]|nr:hypothetical protein [Saprospiraceae bacterium]